MAANYSKVNSFIYPSGTTAARPTSVNNGFIYFNTTVGALQIYQNGSWYVLTNINAPGTPTSAVATDQGTGRAYNNGQASISFTPATETVGFPATYTVTSTPGSYTASGTSSPLVITGLQSSTQYTYTVTATNNTSSSSASSASSGVTATTVPQAPTITATAGDTVATIAITPGATGGAAISQYTITSNPATTTQTTSNTSYTFTGLTNGTAYTFTATATNSNGTSLASSATSSITPAVAITGAYEPIASIIVPSGGLASITFNSIPQTYTHLQIRYIAKNATTSGTDQTLYAQFNNDTSSSYSWHRLYGYNTTTYADNATSQTQTACGFVITSTSGLSNIYSAGIVDILDFSNENKNKTIRALTGDDGNTVYGGVGIISGSWLKTSAISSITLFTGSNFAANSSFALYGVKG